MMMTLVVVTVYVAVLMAGVPSAAQAVDQTDALATLQNGVVMQCKKTHTGGCTNHRQISISLKRNVDYVSRCLEECTQDERCEGFSFGKTNTPVDRTCILYREGCQKDSTNQRWDFYSKKDCITSGVSLKEYQEQLDIFKKSIDVQRRDMVKLKALLDKVQGRVDTLNNTVVRSCSQDSDCTEPLHFCLNGWCSIAECSENSHCQGDNPACDTFTGRCYTYEKDRYCLGNDLATYPTLDSATAACRSEASCGCIWNPYCDGVEYRISVGTSTGPTGLGSCSWVKT
jgi:hypothetical protein